MHASCLAGKECGLSAGLHYIDGGPLTLQYLLAVDAINFCFWPQPGLEYEHLARGLKVSYSVPSLLL